MAEDRTVVMLIRGARQVPLAEELFMVPQGRGAVARSLPDDGEELRRPSRCEQERDRRRGENRLRPSASEFTSAYFRSLKK